MEKATREKLTPDEAALLAEALRRHEPWLEWAGKRETPGFAVDPVALHIHERVPAWATRMKFHLRQGRVTIGTAEFVDVTAMRAQAPASPPAEHSAGATAPRAPAIDEAVDEAIEEDVPAPRQKVGRKSYDALIRQALQAMWPEVRAAAARAPLGQPSFRALAPKIRRQCERLCKGQTDVRIPHKNTIRKNLPVIYRTLLDEKGCAK